MARSARPSALASRGTAKRTVAFVMRGYGPAIAGIATTAFVGGLVEALFLIIVTRAAFAISKTQSEVGIVALPGMARIVQPAGALVLVIAVSAFGQLLRPLRTIVRRRARTATAAGMDFAVSVNEVSELGFELHVFHVQARAQARVAVMIER